jgi:hypothetical protein
MKVNDTFSEVISNIRVDSIKIEASNIAEAIILPDSKAKKINARVICDQCGIP